MFKALLYTVAAVTAAVTCANYARSEPEGTTVRDRTTFDPRPPIAVIRKAAELSKWIAEHSSYKETDRQPAYVFWEPEVIQYMYYEPTANGYTGAETSDIMAIYMDGTMFLRTDFDLKRDEHILLHQLVHHAQFLERREYSCTAAAERDAYMLQNLFVDETGKGEKSDPISTLILTQCQAPY